MFQGSQSLNIPMATDLFPQRVKIVDVFLQEEESQTPSNYRHTCDSVSSIVQRMLSSLPECFIAIYL